MASLPKYLISAKIEVDGPVEKPDVIGAIFGQTEGLFPDMNLHELQEKGRVGRIEVELEQKEGRILGAIRIPTSLDRTATALLAAIVESVERVGPYACKISIDKILDVRHEKRRSIARRAKELLRAWTLETKVEVEELVKGVQEVLRAPQLIEYGEDRLPAGAGVEISPSIIVVEGRADVLHLLDLGYTNVIAMEGAHVPETIVKLSEKREVTAFLDGDRSGDLLLKELLSKASVDFVARAPRGKEVESLTGKEVAKALRERIPASEALKVVEAPLPIPRAVAELIPSLRDTLEAVLLDEQGREVARFPVSQLVKKLDEVKGVRTIVFDGVITQRLVDAAGKQGIQLIIGERLARGVKDLGLCLLTSSQALKRGSLRARS